MLDTATTTTTFYRAALRGLCAIEHHDRTTRRFGPEADAAWAMFHGHLDAADRIDLLLRDAAARHPAAFAPRVVFALDTLPETRRAADLETLWTEVLEA